MERRDFLRLSLLGGVGLLGACIPQTPIIVSTLTKAATATNSSVPTATQAATETVTPTATSTSEPALTRSDFEQVADRANHLVRAFPGSEIFSNANANIYVIINRETGFEALAKVIELPGAGVQAVVRTKEYYQAEVRNYLRPGDVERRLENLGDLAAELPREKALERLRYIAGLHGYQDNGRNIAGMPEILDPDQNELARVLNTLVDLNEGKTFPDLRTARPRPHNLIAILGYADEKTRTINSVQKGLFDPSRDFNGGRVNNAGTWKFSKLLRDEGGNEIFMFFNDYLLPPNPTYFKLERDFFWTFGFGLASELISRFTTITVYKTVRDPSKPTPPEFLELYDGLLGKPGRPPSIKDLLLDDRIDEVDMSSFA